MPGAEQVTCFLPALSTWQTHGGDGHLAGSEDENNVVLVEIDGKHKTLDVEIFASKNTKGTNLILLELGVKSPSAIFWLKFKSVIGLTN